MIHFRPYPWLTAATLLGLAALIGLGTWQLQRLSWKTALIAAAETRARAAPIDIAELLARPAAEREYAHVRAVGAFLPGEAFLFTKLEDGRVGFEVITPFRLAGGETILVDRGFVPAAHNRPASHAGPPPGDVEITGLLRASRRPGSFTPAADAANRIWYGRDAPAIGKALGVSVAPVFLALDAGPPGQTPEGGHTKLAFRNDHLEYAITWFALAGVMIVVYLAYHRSKGRLRF